ncbi:hypothetical protein M422DRAFT_272279 [Sphaerobolus stellatus SS14]|uniref:Uncharacterized protein n=1 Tax=Sphaerobolus stellatus (strain SS14) TaxID=990650 RepID=A0A0C9UC01_SPHS4|nr:hypothetical protein M422DRAFT_272279 [Sphaerobolus stellatus SS14]
MVAACAICQGDPGYSRLERWKKWASHCAIKDSSVAEYPLQLPSGITVSAWAYLNVEKIGIFDEIQAKIIAVAPRPIRPRFSDMIIIDAAGGPVSGALVLSVLTIIFLYRRPKLQKDQLAYEDIPETEPHQENRQWRLIFP